MRRIAVLMVLTAAVALVSCQKAPESTGPWFEGDLDSALAEATQRGSLVMMEFYSDT